MYQEAAGEEEEEDDLERSAQNTSQGSGEANKVRFLTTLSSLLASRVYDTCVNGVRVAVNLFSLLLARE